MQRITILMEMQRCSRVYEMESIITRSVICLGDTQMRLMILDILVPMLETRQVV